MLLFLTQTNADLVDSRTSIQDSHAGHALKPSSNHARYESLQPELLYHTLALDFSGSGP